MNSTADMRDRLEDMRFSENKPLLRQEVPPGHDMFNNMDALLNAESRVDFMISRLQQRACSSLNRDSDLVQRFEQEVNPNVEFIFDSHAEDSPAIGALATFTTVTTFLAAFAFKDFGSFDAQHFIGRYSWYSQSLYLILMAFVLGNTIYLSIVGTMIVVVYYRSKNQCREWSTWANSCRELESLIRQAFSEGHGLKGQRYDVLKDAIEAIYTSQSAYGDVRTMCRWFFLCKPAKDYTDNLFSLSWNAEKYAWQCYWTPPPDMIVGMAFDVLQRWTLVLAVISYVVAQAMRALQESYIVTTAVVSCILTYWILQMCWRLGWIFFKLNR